MGSRGGGGRHRGRGAAAAGATGSGGGRSQGPPKPKPLEFKVYAAEDFYEAVAEKSEAPTPDRQLATS